MTAENQTDARTSPPSGQDSPPPAATGEPLPMPPQAKAQKTVGEVVFWSIMGGFGLSLATGYLARTVSKSYAVLAQGGQWQAFMLYLGASSAYFFPCAALIALQSWRAAGMDRRSFAAVTGCAALGLPLSVLCWGGFGVLPWSLACFYMALLPALESYLGPRLGLAPSLLNGWQGDNPSRVGLGPLPVLLALVSEAYSMLYIVLIFFSTDAFDTLVLARTGIAFPASGNETRALFLGFMYAGNVCKRFGNIFRPSQAGLVSITYLALMGPLAGVSAWLTMDFYWWLTAIPFSVITCSILFNMLDRERKLQAKSARAAQRRRSPPPQN